MAVPIDNPLDKNSIYFNMFFNNYDIINPSADILSQVRRDFFSTRRKVKGKACLTADGEKLTYIYLLDTNGKIKWQKYTDGILTERSVNDAEGYHIECKDRYGCPVKTLYFDKMHTWQKTEYFSSKDNQTICKFMPWYSDDKAAVARYDKGEDMPEILFSLKMPCDQKMVNLLVNKVNPAVSACTNCGFSYFGNDEIEDLWNKSIKLLQEQRKKPIIESDINA